MLFGITPFESLTPAGMALLFVIYFLSFFIRGAIGFGSATPAVIGSAWVLPPHDAVLIALLTSLFAQVQLLPQGLREANWTVARPVLAGTVVSVVIGVWIFANLRSEWLTIVLGACLSFAVAADILRVAQNLARVVDLQRFSVGFWLSAFAGLMSAVTGAGGNYFLAFYIRWAAPHPKVFRATNIVISGFISFWRSIVVAIAGLLSLKLVIEAVLVMPVVYLGGWAGQVFAGRLSAERYFRIVQVLLLLAAASLIWKGGSAIWRGDS